MIKTIVINNKEDINIIKNIININTVNESSIYDIEITVGYFVLNVGLPFKNSFETNVDFFITLADNDDFVIFPLVDNRFKHFPIFSQIYHGEYSFNTYIPLNNQLMDIIEQIILAVMRINQLLVFT